MRFQKSLNENEIYIMRILLGTDALSMKLREKANHQKAAFYFN